MIVNGWFDFAIRVPGPPDKVYSQQCTSEVYLPHDAVGYLGGWYSRLFDMERDENGRYTPNAAASVTGIVLDEIDPLTGDAKLIQHYSIDKSCWASGARSINCRGNAFETERIRGDFNNLVLPAHMVRTHVRIARELAAHGGWDLRRPTDDRDLTATCMEHRECTRFGAASTSCPSDRADQIWEALTQPEGRMYTDAEIDDKIGEALALGVRNQSNLSELANGIDAVSVANKWPLSLKGLWFVARKAWPF